MSSLSTYRIEVGEYGILGAGAHLSVRFVDEDGQRIVEINGLATNRAGLPAPVGAAVLGHDILGYLNWGPVTPNNGSFLTMQEPGRSTRLQSDLLNNWRRTWRLFNL